ncbi:MAG: hypothetical protein ABR538_18275 [Candidatus Binatia bacterium]
MFVEAQQLVVSAWAAVAAVSLGLGLLAGRLFGPRLERAEDLWPTFWTGWALLLCLLQVWHLFLAVDDRARIAVATLAVLGWLVAGTAPWRLLAKALPRNIIPLLAIAATVWWLSDRSLAGPRFGDTGMYLIPTVHWYGSHAAVPGLANLFVPLGHNLSYFLYGALLDGGPLTHRIYHVINSVLVMALLARGLVACGRLLRRDSQGVAADLFHALALFPVMDLAVGLFLTSPSPDTGVFLFGLALAAELVVFLSQCEPSRAAMIRLVFLSAAGMTLKLSIAGLSVATGAMALLWWLWRRRPSVGQAAAATALVSLAAAFPLGTWMIRNVVSSGYPLYPAFVFPMPVDWIARVDATAWIQKPMAMAPLWTVFTQWGWWQTRLLSLGWAEMDAVWPLTFVAVGASLFVLGRLLEWRRRPARELTVLVLVAPIAAFWFSFVNTPMPRYQGATLWILGIDFVVLALAAIVAGGGRLLRGAVVVATLALAALPLVRTGEYWLGADDFEPTSSPRLHEETLASGLVVQVPENQVCWYAPLPCTPEPHPGLRLREPGNLAAGFAIDPGPEPAVP